MRLAAPVAAGFTWRSLTPRDSLIAAAIVAVTVGGVAGLLFWRSVAYPGCEYGANGAPGDWMLPSLVLGVLIGGALAVSGLVDTRLARGASPCHRRSPA